MVGPVPDDPIWSIPVPQRLISSSISSDTPEYVSQNTMTDEEAIKWFREWATKVRSCQVCGHEIVPTQLALQVKLHPTLLIIDGKSNNPLQLPKM